MFNVDYIQENRLSNFMYGVYGWMCGALALTASISYYISITPEIFQALHGNPGITIGLIIFQLALVIGLAGFHHKMSFPVALAAFLTYAATLGVSLSGIFFIYTTGSIVTTFVTAAGMFGFMAVYGYVTKADLTSVGSISIMMLWGLIITGLINIFFRSPMVDLILSGVGVIVFTLLTAYDSQKLKRIGQQMEADQETMAKVALLGALTLYLDFINLFLYLLRFMGKRNND